MTGSMRRRSGSQAVVVRNQISCSCRLVILCTIALILFGASLFQELTIAPSCPLNQVQTPCPRISVMLPKIDIPPSCLLTL